MDYKKLGADIVKNVGGVDNIDILVHCMTRLRFNLKDVSKANKEALEDLDGVLGVTYAGGQYMVILGKDLLPTYQAIIKDFDIQTGKNTDENLDNLDTKKEPLTWKNVGGKVIGFVSASVTPLLPGLIAGGMMKVALLLVVTFISPHYANTSSYLLLSAIADSPFYFMPIIVAYGAATKMGATPVYAMVATASLLHGNFTTLVTAAKHATLFGMSVKMLNYGSTLLPALLIAITAYYAEKFFNKIVPGIFRSVFVGMGTIFVSGSLGFLILGPLGNMLGQGIASGFMFLNSTVGPLAVGLLAACLPWMVMAGMHTALTPFMPQLLSNPGYDAILRPAFLLHNMAEGGANLGVAARTKNAKFRSECISLAIGCIVAGVTEPAIYGVNLKYRRPMYGVMAGGFVGGFIASLLGAKAYVMGYSNVLALPIFQKTIMAMVFGIIAAIATSAVVTFILGIKEEPSKNVTKPVQETYPDDAIVSVSDGTLMNIENVNDEAFSSKALGDGIAIKLNNDFVCSPANGTLETMFPTGHAFGVLTNEGVEMLVHIGLDTVKAKGDGFDVLVKQGEKVRAGQPIVRVDRAKLKKQGYDLTTMLVITNDNNQEIDLKQSGDVKVGTALV
ncbi:glucose PTS transporter subunit IIA [Companilactobacillus halodurans]|uniref:PTS beta-glucoside transporter subunit EIIBCA n=1 Tax=Companilactobacillus halodurans TaxID=2584183 RepID=A0A5P0ZX76_9LACO|nr:glucose PTS transporter subunit IIA [Companilactobacillus halodurans]MQS75261.1 PTS beta-glucoside transporter subunit EIIBCA [Companilactobacillus halodurans]MQS97610.1 PTS beta-glucoside transporter subunit EIIBCA [Companilactobacillus halodurans]